MRCGGPFVDSKYVAGIHQEDGFGVLLQEQVSLGHKQNSFGNNIIIRLGVSQIPMGLTPGHLSSMIRRHASSGERPSGSIRVVQSRLAMAASAWDISCKACLKEVQSHLQPYGSMPEGPAAL